MTDIPADRLAWLAGVIDVIGLVRTRPVDSGAELCYVGVSSARRDLLNELAELTGTKVTTVNREYNRLGCGEHCTEAHMHVHSSTGRWSLTGARAVVFLSALEPYLTTRKDDVATAIAAGLTAPYKAATVQKMYALGWPHLDEIESAAS